MTKKTKKEDYSQQPEVQVVESNETYGHELFTIVNHNGEHLVAVGNQVVTREKFATREEAIAYIDRKPWELIFNSCAVMFTNLMKQQENNQQ